MNVKDMAGDPAARPPRLETGLKALDLLSVALILAVSLALLFLSQQRSLAGYGTETDFIGSMVPEAQRLVNGEPLLSEFHPPGYVLALVAVQQFVPDWFGAGMVLSTLSGIACLTVFWLLFRILDGPVMALGAVVGLTSSATFLLYAQQASSDAFALALYASAMLAAAAAWTRRSTFLWLLTGFAVLLAMSTRTSGLTLLLLLALPLLLPSQARLNGLLAGLAGLGLGVVAFAAFGAATGSNLMPHGTYHNIALTYFTDERVMWEGMLEARARFDSLLDVLTHDPLAMAKGYSRDLIHVTADQIPVLAGPAIALLFLPGLLFALLGNRSYLLFAMAAVTLAQLLLVNLKAFEPRYHIYATPWLGAGALFLVNWIASRKDWPILSRRIISIGLATMICAGAFLALSEAHRFAASGGNRELAEALPIVQRIVGPDDTVVARKPHIAYYTGAENQWLAELGTAEELRSYLEQGISAGELYLFIGRIEQQSRPKVAAIAARDPDWLTLVAGAKKDGWALYRYEPG